jgi:hypothetical protein
MVSYIKGGMQAKGICKLDIERISGSSRNENGEWIRLYSVELFIMYPSPNIVTAIKSRRL